MKKAIRVSVSVLLVLGMLIGFAGCGESGKVRKVISNFQTGCNNKDINAVLDCIDPSISGIIRGLTDFAGKLLGEDSASMFDQLSQYLVENQDEESEDFFETLNIKVREVAVDASTASALCTISYKGVSNANVERSGTIECKLSGENWYITNLSLH